MEIPDFFSTFAFYKADSDPKLTKSAKRDYLPMKASWMQEIKMAKNSREQGEKMGMAEEDLPKVPTHMTAYARELENRNIL